MSRRPVLASGAMNKWVKRILGVLLGLVLGLGVGYASIYMASNSKIADGRHVVQPRPVEIPTEGPEHARALARGEHLLRAVYACTECHGEDLGGKLFIDGLPMARIAGSNLTSGRGGVGGRYEDVDWVRAIRHGVGKNGNAFLIMPTSAFSQIADGDLAAIVAYLKTLPPVDREVPRPELGPIGRILVALGELPIEAEDLDHARVGLAGPRENEDSAYGRYLVETAGCVPCHGERLEGKETDPHHPVAPNLTPGGELGGWSREDFTRAMRQGRRPDGRELDAMMPWRVYQHMTDLEIGAIWEHLQAVEAVSPGEEG